MLQWTKATNDALLRFALRALPLIPAPEMYDLIRSVGKSEKNLDREIQEAFAALSKSSGLVDDLNFMLKEREQKLLSLQAEYERISELSRLTQNQADAVAKSLEIALGRSASRERLIAFGINIAAGLILFVIGVFASDWVKQLISVWR
ncbi:hypothetical protein N5J77_29725 [Sphingobium yanoikuyae]|uniref:Uncharacterized protein n=1 Tax=Sphingobium yanoikuyae TaxID=13690 RepID=A0AA42X3Y1_SPHYA|nr:hypothetical protein [Sphingobium yanoikuyae]MDH2135302.1 hypothetical protein [Sphingobium yanoikuyae]MDH2153528.1 hypothetical protein [Sphingobium yanoikuyae]MDH2170650.1 hypothetical protein [Sphingobium yanoikuyae]